MAAEILYDLYVRGDSKAEVRVNKERRKFRLISDLRALREKSGLSHSALASKLGMSELKIVKKGGKRRPRESAGAA